MKNKMQFFVAVTAMLFFSVMTIGLSAQTLHMILVAQNDNSIGSPKDLVTMKNLAQEIKNNVNGLNVRTLQLNSASASKSAIQNQLSSANIGPNDVVWYYYSGHGQNYDQWPRSAEKGVPLTWVHSQLKRTRARLTLATYDCCSLRSPIASPPSDVRPKSSLYKILFLEAKGHIIMASCSSGELSYGNPQSGGIFTNSFIDALRSSSNWNDVLVNAKSNTKNLARELGRVQVPIYDNQSRTNAPIPAPVYSVRTGETLVTIASEMQDIAQQNKYNVKIKVKDIKRWNPGVNEQNLHTKFKTLKYKPGDPELEQI